MGNRVVVCLCKRVLRGARGGAKPFEVVLQEMRAPLVDPRFQAGQLIAAQ